MSALACSGDRDLGTIRQGGHTLKVREITEPGSLVRQTAYVIELTLDGEPLKMQRFYHAVSPPQSLAPRTQYLVDPGAVDWTYAESFNLYPSSAQQHDAAKELLSHGTGALHKAVSKSFTRYGYAPGQHYVLWEVAAEPASLIFESSSGDRIKVTTSGAIFMQGALIGKLSSQAGVPTTVEIDLEPHTFGSGPAEIAVAPKERELAEYMSAQTGQDFYSTYGLTAP